MQTVNVREQMIEQQVRAWDVLDERVLATLREAGLVDREPGVVNASTFQVWGQREGPQGEQPLPMNLGILYMDNESNRRWVLRFDDPKQLAEIDAVFVTIEPRGGSHKPTSKPFLYALLRKEVNHP